MQREVIKELLKLNEEFYRRFAAPFSESRRNLQPGVQRLLHRIPIKARLLDLGCGNGRLWIGLNQAGFQGEYVGLEWSQELLALARQNVEGEAVTAQQRPLFFHADLTDTSWVNRIPPAPYEVIVAFAVLHHLPGNATRIALCQTVRQIISKEGFFILSAWQFMRSTRWKARLLPWETIGLTQAQVEEGDFLLDWRRGGYGLRYVHLFDEDELHLLAQQSQFRITETFYSDGREGNLSIYQVWQPA